MWQGKPKGNPLPSLIFPCHQFLLLKELHSKRSLQPSWFLFVQKYKELHIFPFLFHWRPRELEFAQSSPDIWELILPRSEDEMLVKRRWKFYSSAAPTFSFHCFYFIHLILERKNKGKKQTPKQKTPNHNTTSPYKFTFKQSFVPAGYRNSDLLTRYILKIDKNALKLTNTTSCSLENLQIVQCSTGSCWLCWSYSLSTPELVPPIKSGAGGVIFNNFF